MSISFYDASVGSYLQLVSGMAVLLKKGRKHFEEAGENPDDILAYRFAPDMFPFAVQAVVVEAQCVGVVAALRSGEFSPPFGVAPPATYEQLQQRVEGWRTSLEAVTPSEIEALADGDVILVHGESRVPFTAKNFVMSFSLPNFYFHATIMYAMLRAQGVPLGRRDYLGPLKVKA